MKLTWLFFLFITSAQGQVRLARWRELRKHCLDHAYEGQKRAE